MPNLKELQEALESLSQRYGHGASFERRAQNYLTEACPDLDDDAIYDVVDGVGELAEVNGKIVVVEKPEPYYDTITQPNGWLSPDGKFYPCKFHGHDSLAYRIVKSLNMRVYNPYATLEQNLWIKLQLSPMKDAEQLFIFDWEAWREGKRPTEIQKSMVREFYTKHCPKQIPVWDIE